MKQVEELIEISKMLEFDKLKVDSDRTGIDASVLDFI